MFSLSGLNCPYLLLENLVKYLRRGLDLKEHFLIIDYSCQHTCQISIETIIAEKKPITPPT